MKLIKMSIVNSIEFEQAFNACQMAYGFVAQKKRTLVWIAIFDIEDYGIIRETLESTGSQYRGLWRL